MIKQARHVCGLAVVITALALGCGPAGAQMFKLPQTLILKHEERIKLRPARPARASFVDVLDDVAETEATGEAVGYVAGPGGSEAACVAVGADDPEGSSVSAAILSSIGITGFRRREGDVQFRIGYQSRPPILYRGAAPGACDDDFRARAEAELTRLLDQLAAEPITVTAIEILRHLPLGGDAPTGTLTIRKTVSFFDDQKEVVFEVPLGRIL